MGVGGEGFLPQQGDDAAVHDDPGQLVDHHVTYGRDDTVPATIAYAGHGPDVKQLPPPAGVHCCDDEYYLQR